MQTNGAHIKDNNVTTSVRTTQNNRQNTDIVGGRQRGKYAQTNTFYGRVTKNLTILAYFNFELIYLKYSGKYSLTALAS
jgi:hypothetical protein